MKILWNMVNGLNANNGLKNGFFLFLLVMTNILVGAVAWCLIGRFFLPGMDWLLCFIGYPAVFIGFFGGIRYLCKHDFA